MYQFFSLSSPDPCAVERDGSAALVCVLHTIYVCTSTYTPPPHWVYTTSNRMAMHHPQDLGEGFLQW